MNCISLTISEQDAMAVMIVAGLIAIFLVYYAMSVEPPEPKPAEPSSDATSGESKNQGFPPPCKPGMTGIQILGVLLIIASAAGAALTFTMDTTYGNMHNIGLLNAQLIYALGSGFLFIGGLLMSLLGRANK